MACQSNQEQAYIILKISILRIISFGGVLSFLNNNGSYKPPTVRLCKF